MLASNLMNKTLGLFSTVENGYLSYEIRNAPINFIYEFEEIIIDDFGASRINHVNDIDVIYIDIDIDGHILILGEDDWSGCFIFATSEEGEENIVEIGMFFNKLYPKSNFFSREED